VKILLLTLKLVLAAACLAVGGLVRLPILSEFRPWLLLTILIASTLTITSSCGWRGWSHRDRLARLDLAPFALAALALFIALAVEGRFRYARWIVLHTNPAVLETLGRHIMVGYRKPAFVRELVERRAIAGGF